MYQFEAATCSSMLEAFVLVVVYFYHLKKLVRPETFGPYYVNIPYDYLQFLAGGHIIITGLYPVTFLFVLSLRN